MMLDINILFAIVLGLFCILALFLGKILYESAQEQVRNQLGGLWEHIGKQISIALKEIDLRSTVNNLQSRVAQIQTRPTEPNYRSELVAIESRLEDLKQGTANISGEIFKKIQDLAKRMEKLESQIAILGSPQLFSRERPVSAAPAPPQLGVETAYPPNDTIMKRPQHLTKDRMIEDFIAELKPVVGGTEEFYSEFRRIEDSTDTHKVELLSRILRGMDSDKQKKMKERMVVFAASVLGWQLSYSLPGQNFVVTDDVRGVPVMDLTLDEVSKRKALEFRKRQYEIRPNTVLYVLSPTIEDATGQIVEKGSVIIT